MDEKEIIALVCNYQLDKGCDLEQAVDGVLNQLESEEQLEAYYLLDAIKEQILENGINYYYH